MKILYLLRHAEASPARRGQDDAARPLSAEGRAHCETLASLVEREGGRIDLALGSPALRVRETLERVIPPFAPDRIDLEDGLYLAPDHALLDRLRSVEPAAAGVLLVAHNPGLHALARRLAGRGEAPLRRALAGGFPAAALAELHFDAETWDAIRDGRGTLVRFFTP